jgi:hypothetical protein
MGGKEKEERHNKKMKGYKEEGEIMIMEGREIDQEEDRVKERENTFL